ncbi:hypothetical protein HMPREF9443_01869 [Phascolarctobacterium succinatutens YIT 12067]|uniref:Uncharacterized protein n=1 Tax=Phascolarctobacterium succinatutens YIT 12067 TaxID=626939 RepID=E8LG68_9FIRM|nr:hypothetical protein HMPREF9443_01869 [Phascolarctobacterium succinatutens YIT 12067]
MKYSLRHCIGIFNINFTKQITTIHCLYYNMLLPFICKVCTKKCFSYQKVTEQSRSIKQNNRSAFTPAVIFAVG